jgi:membrane associated rhomboid family serine protease
MADLRPRGLQSIPIVIKNLLIINVLVYVAELTFGGRFIDLLVLHYHKSPDFRIWQLVTYMFLHSPSDFTHILFNMLVLWMFGSNLEEIWGAKRFLLFYLICGVGAALIQLGVLAVEMNYLESQFAQAGPAFQQEFLQKGAGIYYFSALGASGALTGIMSGFAYLFPNYPVQLFLIPIPIKVKYMVIGYFLVDLFAGINPGAGDNVAHIAHVGGAIVGLILVITMNKSNRKTFY